MFSYRLISPNDLVGNKRDSDKSLALLISLMSNFGFHSIITYPKNSIEQVTLGIDLTFSKNGNRYSADHKSRSRKWGHRGLFSLELTNNAGEKGSLFKNTQDYFILEGSKNFVFFKTKNLQTYFLNKVNIFQIPILSNSAEAFDKEKKHPKLHTLLTRSFYNRWWDGKPNEDKFAWFTYQEVVPLICYKIPILK